MNLIVYIYMKQRQTFI